MEIRTVELVENYKNTALEIVEIKPNPWTDFSNLEYFIETESDVNVLITDLQGKQVYSLTTHQRAGLNRLQLTNDILPHPGVYLIHIDNGNTTATKKMIKLE